jgi:hypothetical protein
MAHAGTPYFNVTYKGGTIGCSECERGFPGRLQKLNMSLQGTLHVVKVKLRNKKGKRLESDVLATIVNAVTETNAEKSPVTWASPWAAEAS